MNIELVEDQSIVADGESVILLVGLAAIITVVS